VITERPEVFGADEQADVEIDLLHWVRLARFVLTAERVPEEGEMALIFVNETTIADLNQRFLELSGPTDVLAFPMDDEALVGGRQPDLGGRGPGASSEGSDPPIVVGDVIVCPEVARRQAGEHGRLVDDELALLVVHGTLHLLNYDHAEEQDAVTMRRREQELLARFAENEEG
jgi:probable rRNA maturation factor